MRTLVVTIVCNAPLELFTKDFDKLSLKQQELFNEDKIRCRESGTLGLWCDGCPFASIEEDDYDWSENGNQADTGD